LKRIGLLGGVFDPPHEGHLKLALLASAHLGLDELRFVPARAGHRKGAPAAPPGARLEMLREMLRGTAFAVDCTELERDSPSYTAETLEALSGREPGAAWALVVGMDQALGFGDWRRPARILELASVAAAGRPGHGGRLSGALAAHARDEWSGSPGEAVLLPGTDMDLSSRRIRGLLAAGGAPEGLPEKVRAVISEKRLYR